MRHVELNLDETSDVKTYLRLFANTYVLIKLHPPLADSVNKLYLFSDHVLNSFTH